ncbi:hypothetical protein M408DRAFT_326778 [Serendipita vermifera MAFF 305830]|uniref:Uncharacterized protein n=1 Tax=Serendipita vermifera MAFF 305830 TaxID=933852 RepID=A0A0C3BKY3_SERVB|nr:hypothetical protein M408DRAFT_326778 [Serendipita vermifera MAFF 305830]
MTKLKQSFYGQFYSSHRWRCGWSNIRRSNTGPRCLVLAASSRTPRTAYSRCRATYLWTRRGFWRSRRDVG